MSFAYLFCHKYVECSLDWTKYDIDIWKVKRKNKTPKRTYSNKRLLPHIFNAMFLTIFCTWIKTYLILFLSRRQNPEYKEKLRLMKALWNHVICLLKFIKTVVIKQEWSNYFWNFSYDPWWLFLEKINVRFTMSSFQWYFLCFQIHKIDNIYKSSN